MRRFITLWLALTLFLCACGEKTQAPTWQEQYDLGVRYLSEGNYEEAIIAFTAAIEIDPKQADIYSALADAYIALDDYEAAIETLRRGAEAAGASELQARAEEIEQRLEESKHEEEPADVLTRINYYSPSGTLLYHEDYLYYPDGKLGYSLMNKIEEYEDTTYDSTEYSRLYLYDEEGNFERSVLGGLSIADWFDESTGKVTMGYEYDAFGNSTKINIYPKQESVEQEKFGVDPTKTEQIYGEPEFFPDAGDGQWARAYLDEVFSGQEYTDETYCSFQCVNDDSIPELLVDYSYGYAGAQMLTTIGETPDAIWFDHGSCGYLKDESLVRISGGHMDVYYDGIYQVADGKFTQVGSGEYGAEDNANVEYDEAGYPIYRYYWNGTETSEADYQAQMNQIYDQSREISAGQWPLTYNQCKLLLERIAGVS